MMARLPILTQLRHWPRRVAALLMVALQMGIGISPLLDHDGRIPARHAEQRGNRHARAHNEQTCVVCAVRALQEPSRRIDPAPIPRVRQSRLEIEVADAPTSRDPPSANSSRAPPPLS